MVAVAPAPPTVAAAEAPVRLHGDGRWLVDAQGRTVLLHGVNIVYKEPPWIPGEGSGGGFTEADAEFLAANGFNAVRLGVLFAGVMPRPGQIDHDYLDRVDRVVRLLAEQRIWVLLDFHQDAFDQWPDWSIPWNPAVPDDRMYPWPGDYFLSASVNTAYDNLWADIGCADRDAAIQRFQENAAAGIREHDHDGIVWFEPNILSLDWAPSHLGDRPVTDPHPGFTWHVYCTSSEFLGRAEADCAIEEQQVFANGVRTGAKLNAPLILGEFGATNDAAHLRQITDLADRHLLGWMHWSYKAYPGQGSGSALFTDSDDFGTLKPDKADALIRPYPRAIAGTPLELKFDEASGTFTFSYRPDASGAPTEIFVPARHYPGGYTVTVSGGRAVDGGAVLKVFADPGAARVDVTVTR